MVNQESISYADQQFVGFVSCRSGSSIEDLVDAMGLEEEEWEYMCANDMTGIFDESDFDEINAYFRNKA